MSVASDHIWVSVDALTLPTKRLVPRDDGTTTPALILSLWDQATESLAHGSEGDGGARWGSLSEYSPMDLNLMEVRAIIAETTLREVTKRSLERRPTTPGQLRQLAVHVIGYEVEALWWWEYRFSSWARQLSTYLRAAEREVKPIRLRNSPCPRCGAQSVLVDGDDGEVIAPPIVIAFREGHVQGAQCEACSYTWFRGDALSELAQALGVLEAA